MDHWGLKEKRGIVLDFDGTICHLFHGFDLLKTTDCLKMQLDPLGIIFDSSCDAFDVFEVIRNQLADSKQIQNAFKVADGIIKQAEIDAVETCTMIDYCAEFISISLKKGYKIGISTNNSRECVSKFICNQMVKSSTNNDTSNDLVYALESIPIYGRDGTHPELMKPNPWSVLNVVNEMNLSIKDVIFIGDSLRDYDASVAADCQFIAFGSTPKKKERFKTRIKEQLITASYKDLITDL
jgi:phosphoglycolate phosphatase-like HAD superfamily hydrolase